jgi:peptide methionine sulfoxide reductase MsrB
MAPSPEIHSDSSATNELEEKDNDIIRENKVKPIAKKDYLLNFEKINKGRYQCKLCD